MAKLVTKDVDLGIQEDIQDQWFKVLDSENQLVCGVHTGKPVISTATKKLSLDDQCALLLTTVTATGSGFLLTKKEINGKVTFQFLNPKNNSMYVSLNYWDESITTPREALKAYKTNGKQVLPSSREELNLLRNGSQGTSSDALNELAAKFVI